MVQIQQQTMTKTKVFKNIKFILGAVTGLIILSAPFIHKFFKDDIQKTKLETIYIESVSARNKVSKQIKSLNYKNLNENISAEEYQQISKKYWLEYKELDKVRLINKKKLNEYEESIQFFGFKSIYTFLFSIGTSISLFFLSILYFYEIQKKRDFAFAPKAILSFLFVMSSVLLLTWGLSSNNFNDYPAINYYATSVVFSGLGSFLLVSLIRKVDKKRNDLVLIIRKLFGFIYSTADLEDFVKDSRKKEYAIRRGELVEYAVEKENE